MQCKNCAEEVSSRFTHALANNICPFCGCEIIDDALKNALNDLRSAMNAIEDYKVEIFDWLKANFGLIAQAELDAKLQEARAQFEVQLQSAKANIDAKIEEQASKLAAARNPKVANMPLVQPTSTDETMVNAEGLQIQGPAIQTQEQTSKFFKNAEADKIVARNSQVKDLVKQIKTGGASVGIREDGTPMTVNLETMATAPIEMVEEMEQMLTGSLPGVQSGLTMPINGDDDDDIPAAVLAMSRGAAAGADHNAKDVAALQRMISKSQRPSSGGFIRRG
jgi:hypothetical protein